MQQPHPQNVTILDGGMGTEIQKHRSETAPADKSASLLAWGCTTNLTDPTAVLKAHKKFIAAGAEVVITNTYGTNECVLEALGIGHLTHDSIRAAVKIAKQSREEAGKGDVKVAGSVGSYAPKKLVDGEIVVSWSENEELYYEQAAETLLKEGVDMIFIEMLIDRDHAYKLTRGVARACKKHGFTNVPVYLGIGTSFDESQEKINLLGWNRVLASSTVGRETGDTYKENHLFTKEVFEEYLRPFEGCNVVGINVMHTKFPVVLDTIKLIRSFGWEGIIGAYPDHGKWKVPTWEEIPIDEGEALALVDSWVEAGASLVGGCCGIGPEFIEKITKHVANQSKIQGKEAYPCNGMHEISRKSRYYYTTNKE